VIEFLLDTAVYYVLPDPFSVDLRGVGNETRFRLKIFMNRLTSIIDSLRNHLSSLFGGSCSLDLGWLLVSRWELMTLSTWAAKWNVDDVGVDELHKVGVLLSV